MGGEGEEIMWVGGGGEYGSQVRHSHANALFIPGGHEQ